MAKESSIESSNLDRKSGHDSSDLNMSAKEHSILKLQRLLSRYEECFSILDDCRISSSENLAREYSAHCFLASLPHSENLVSHAPLELGLKSLRVEKLEEIAFATSEFLKGKIGEDIGDTTLRYPGKLEGCLAPLLGLQFGASAQAVLGSVFYNLIKSHPFYDGNKKVAVAVVLEVMDQCSVPLSTAAIANIALLVAQSDSDKHSEILKKLEIFLIMKLSGKLQK